jgi:hypothetical protein
MPSYSPHHFQFLFPLLLLLLLCPFPNFGYAEEFVLVQSPGSNPIRTVAATNVASGPVNNGPDPGDFSGGSGNSNSPNSQQSTAVGTAGAVSGTNDGNFHQSNSQSESSSSSVQSSGNGQSFQSSGRFQVSFRDGQFVAFLLESEQK